MPKEMKYDWVLGLVGTVILLLYIYLKAYNSRVRFDSRKNPKELCFLRLSRSYKDHSRIIQILFLWIKCYCADFSIWGIWRQTRPSKMCGFLNENEVSFSYIICVQVQCFQQMHDNGQFSLSAFLTNCFPLMLAYCQNVSVNFQYLKYIKYGLISVVKLCLWFSQSLHI